MAAKTTSVVLIGGGRWGRVHASNLASLLTPQDRVIWVSAHNQALLREAIAKFSGGPRFEIIDNLNDALAAKPDAALVVTAPETHAAIAAQCLQAGIHTFVEKPLAFTAGETRALIDLAREKKIVLGVGLHLLSASYLSRFRDAISSRRMARIAIRWFDSAGEVRYGEAKRADNSVPLVHDVYPHIWSILRVLIGPATATGYSAKEAGGVTRIALSMDQINVEALLGRGARARERKISIAFADGGSADLDFTDEPGTSSVDGVWLKPDPGWPAALRPVMAEVKEFLRQASLPSPDDAWPQRAANCLDSVIGAEVLNSQLIK
ncbi:MAG: Gfo/Idh/MocA family oxidoreductase [Afipia sp.]|nr:Gfo/Idh/MocA family oxidoreductase [Afipia sp.]